MENLLMKRGFSRILFDAIPQLALVLDPKLLVHAVNHAALSYCSHEENELRGERCGEVLGCLHHQENDLGCGFSPFCKTCITRNTALEAIVARETRRAKGKLEFLSGNGMPVFVSASPFEYRRQAYVVIIIEDISLITELQGLIPICASCKKIRDDKGYWSRVENYIEEHSEAEFTHDICPECAKRLYPTLKSESMVI
ncbi:hypothetical protein REC12_22695 [Desulfosporosinus sp. PR]|uniref:hypothetical protein n=1 Tax=Candidatus Desulfosporosinus nitrosoreducens TaxID=3401928 RepID=UPI0027E9EE16|nr:hypothetical protein [Desulfosporosinus sp. PR]MDQ7096408.1 hypothetical protein [Desulfosporosinus sp. PR]